MRDKASKEYIIVFLVLHFCLLESLKAAVLKKKITLDHAYTLRSMHILHLSNDLKTSKHQRT